MAKQRKCRLLFSRRLEPLITYPGPDKTVIKQVIKAGATAQVVLIGTDGPFTQVRFDGAGNNGNKGTAWMDFEVDGITEVGATT
jgi:hypothetical protein